ncbi:MAG: tRNA pseudouridine(38-40) synthase TruA [Betaproteobacteria bacterium]|nr:tRNA pseudouridine(38-40) synthase TruA [Betaproteobacteria bacterium]NCA15761.1 tRNA pseudouridine(38-40) synthase TruA [Betaproteobacteria bacterium]
MKIALGLAYDGTHFNGYQTQPQGNTIQDHLERAICAFLEVGSIATVAAGRTDAGVHASGQVVHLQTNIERPLWNWVRGVNTFLPASIRVRWAAPVPDDFHARFSARSRSYTYTLLNEPVDSPLHQRFATWVFQPLDHSRMNAAAQLLLGEHDFSAFRAAECQAASPIRILSRCEVQREGSLVRLFIEGNAFLHHMVRNIVGSLVEIGRGAQPVEWMGQLLASQDRSAAGRTFAPQGLCLVSVAYDHPFLCVPESSSAA